MAGLKTIIALSFVRPPLLILLWALQKTTDNQSTLPPRLPTNPPQSTTNTTPPLPPQILAIGFLLVILSCSLYPSRLPLLVAATYVLAPLPNFICAKCASPDDFISSEGGGGGAVVDFGRFLTGFLVVGGVGMFDLSLSWGWWGGGCGRLGLLGRRICVGTGTGRAETCVDVSQDVRVRRCRREQT